MVSANRVVYEANAGAAVAPASVTKLLTAAAALEVLEPDTRLSTSVVAAEAPVNGTVPGDLWLVGGGDPDLGTDAWAAQLNLPGPHTSLDALADEVVAAGVRRVEGRIVGDETRYDNERYVSTWPARLIADGEIGPLSALTVNDGFRVWGHPGVPFADPPTAAAALFTDLLEARGVRVGGSAASGPAPAGEVRVATMPSASISMLVDAMLRRSDNGTAELLVKELGLQHEGYGTTAAGVRAIHAVVAKDVPLDGTTIADGSGLSEATRLTCRALTALLTARAGDLATRLPVAGRDGTLARRFIGSTVAGRLRAKTGTLDGVEALAGYVDNISGTTLVFAFVINGRSPRVPGRALQDAAAEVLVDTAP